MGQGLLSLIGNSEQASIDIEYTSNQTYLEGACNITRESKVIAEEDLERRM